MKQELENLQLELEGRNYSKRTVASYCSIVERFLCWIESGNDLTPENVRKYVLLQKRNYSTGTSKLISCAIKHYLLNVAMLPDAAKMIPAIRQESRLPSILSVQEVRSIIGSALNASHKLILTVLYTCAIRLDELINIKISDIDFERKTILIHGKGNKDRYVPINSTVCDQIQTFVRTGSKKKYLCSSIDGSRKLSSRTIGAMINNCSRRAGIEKRVYPHLFRHSAATHLLENGVDIRYIQNLLGHKSILATSQYTHMANQDAVLKKVNFDFLFD